MRIHSRLVGTWIDGDRSMAIFVNPANKIVVVEAGQFLSRPDQSVKLARVNAESVTVEINGNEQQLPLPPPPASIFEPASNPNTTPTK